MKILLKLLNIRLKREVSCPYCGEYVDVTSGPCPHCGEHF